MGASSSSPLAACPLCLFLGGFFQALRLLRVFALVLQAFLSVGLQPVSVWSCFLGLLSFRQRWFPVLSYPCGVSRFAALSLFLSVPGILVAWLVASSLPFGGAPPSPFCSLAFSWLWSDPFSFSSPSLRSVLVALLSALSSFFAFWSPLGSPFPLGFSFLRVVCSCLLSPVGRLVSPGSPRL